jgi:hypothetical protein
VTTTETVTTTYTTTLDTTSTNTSTTTVTTTVTTTYSTSSTTTTTTTTSSGGTSQLTINTQNLSGNAISGYYTLLYQGGQLVKSGFTPTSFTVNNGQTYTIEVQDFGSCTFDHWTNPTSTTRDQVIVANTDTTMTAVYNCGGSSGSSTINVATTNSVGTAIAGYYVTLWQNGKVIQSCYSPCSFSVSSGQTYQVGAADFGGETFSHWGDGSTSPLYTVSVTAGGTITSLTAVYNP